MKCRSLYCAQWNDIHFPHKDTAGGSSSIPSKFVLCSFGIIVYLRTVQHSHHNGLDDIVKVVSKRDLYYILIPVLYCTDTLCASVHKDNGNPYIHNRIKNFCPEHRNREY